MLFAKKKEVDGNLALATDVNETEINEMEMHQETGLPQDTGMPREAELPRGTEYEVRTQIAAHQPVQSQGVFAPPESPAIPGKEMAKTAGEFMVAMTQLLQGFKTTDSSIWENLSANAREIQEAFFELETLHENAAKAARRARVAADNIFTAIEGR